MIRLKKLILLILCFVVSTGFTVIDEFEVEKDKIIEKMKITMSKSEFEKERKNIDSDSFMLKSYYGSVISYYDGKVTRYYSKKIEEIDDLYKIYLNTYYSFDEFKDSINPSICFNAFDYKYKKNKISVYLKDGFRCTEAKDTKIIVTSTYQILGSNADKVEENKLTWNFTNVSKDKTLYLNLSDKRYTAKLKSEDIITYAIIGGILVIIIVLIIKKSKKNNEI